MKASKGLQIIVISGALLTFATIISILTDSAIPLCAVVATFTIMFIVSTIRREKK